MNPERARLILNVLRTATIGFLAYNEVLEQEERERKWWVRPMFQDRDQHGFYETTFKKLKEEDEEMFIKATRMRVAEFDALLNLIKFRLEKSSNRKPIPAECLLALTIIGSRNISSSVERQKHPKMSSANETTSHTRKYPFQDMNISNHKVLNNIQGRHPCARCNRSRKFFCYTCYVPVGEVGEIIPRVEIPLQIDIIKHKKEIDGKSTAIHAAILAPDKVSIYTYPEIPDYSNEKDVVLIYPSATSLTVPQLFGKNIRLMTENNYGLPKGYNMGTKLRFRVQEIVDNDEQCDINNSDTKRYTYDQLPVKRAVFIDSTWNQSVSIFKDERIKCLRRVVLQNRMSQFWRHQRKSPRWYLATIEAIHQFLLEMHINAWGLNTHYRGLISLEISEDFYEKARFVEADEKDLGRVSPYNGQYDNLMFFFANMYDLIHEFYDHNELKSYRRPI